jgi:hypothetical protein
MNAWTIGKEVSPRGSIVDASYLHNDFVFFRGAGGVGESV